MNIDVKNFLKKVEYDPNGQQIFAINEKDEMQLILDVRGWGAIQNMFDDINEAARFQDEIGQYVAEAINKKILSDN